MSATILKIPYGLADYETIRNENYYFVDKTRFIPLLEQHRFVVFIRPRRSKNSEVGVTAIHGGSAVVLWLGVEGGERGF